MFRILTFILLVTCLFCSRVSFSHHAFTEFDRGTTIEIEGELVDVLWRNPHIRFEVNITNVDGVEERWEVEGASTSILSRLGIEAENFKVGEQIRVAGWPVWSGENRLNANNVLLAGKEYVLGSRGSKRWLETADGTEHSLLAGGTASDDMSIFRVWSTDADDPHSNTPGFWKSDYPLTESARNARELWVPLTASQCNPKGMPTVMEQPYPIEFAHDGSNIILKLEEYDTVRRIHMDTSSQSEGPATLLGYSRGRWDDRTLVVETSSIDWDYFDKQGIPQGDAMTVVEHFTPSSDGSRLEYLMTVTDSEVFTEPVTLERHWVWRPGEVVKPYDCI